jgi:hypothetical protein
LISNLYALFALVTYLLATACMFFGWALTLTPGPEDQAYEFELGILGVALALLALTRFLMRKSRIEDSVDSPNTRRLTDVGVVIQAVVCAVFLILMVVGLISFEWNATSHHRADRNATPGRTDGKEACLTPFGKACHQVNPSKNNSM